MENQIRLPYHDVILRINQLTYREMTDGQLRECLYSCTDTAEIYAAVKEIVFRCTGLRLFDTQLAAAYSMQRGRIAELPTGEGKTLAAVVTAVSFAMQKKSVHILVFNDYLAKRDYQNNLAIYEFCGLSVGYIDQKSNTDQRRKAYACDIVYLTAKEAGFDYLRDFLCEREEELISPAKQYAIVDEADSILIDEAKIPLILAGSAQEGQVSAASINLVAASLSVNDYAVNKEENQICLTDSGAIRVERQLGISSLYDESNPDVLPLLNAALEARFILERDKDYIVKDNTIQLIDELTGRVAVSRRYPDILHHAVEVKEGIAENSQTIIYNSMTLQAFLQMYEHLCGMTGTVQTSAKEIQNMYALETDEIPPHVPCVRIDHEDTLLDTAQEKTDAVIREIQKAHAKGQPVLLGTGSIRESEQYSKLLQSLQLPHSVLNARNDEQEAELIAKAGEPYRITVSTNMAGRGVDIKLGGEHEEKKDFVQSAGGLYVISTGINRSLRIDNQLRGRAGRQGDAGESRFFISREDPVLSEYFTDELYQRLSEKQRVRLIRRAQKDYEGRDSEARYMLDKYAYIIEEHRKFISEYRTGLLKGSEQPRLLQERDPERYQALLETAGQGGIEKAEKQLALYYINQYWAKYLDSMENVRNGIHLTIIGGKNPLDEYLRQAVAAFEEMTEDIKNSVVQGMSEYEVSSDGIDMKKSGLSGATTTWTYMIDESVTQFSRVPQLMKSMSNAIQGTLFSFSDVFQKVKTMFGRK